LIFYEIPSDPNANAFSLGNTLGAARRHWRRAKFLQRFRLFFRFDSASRIIIYAWVNDENTLRKAGSQTDPYAVFSKRLNAGNPPDDWVDLLAEASRSD
jgi:toxin YhaV